MYRPILLNANQFCPVKNELMTKLDNSKTFTWNGTLSFNPKRIFAEHWTWHCIENPFYSHSHIFHSPSLPLSPFIFFSLCFVGFVLVYNLKRQYDPTPYLIFKRNAKYQWIEKPGAKAETIYFESRWALYFFFSLKHRRAINTDTCDWTC